MLQNVRAENAVGLSVGHKLDHSIDIFIRQGAAVGAERELADAIIDPLLFCLLFSQPDTGEFGVGVNDSGNRVIVYVAIFARDPFDARDPFILGLVREHWPGDHVADGVNAFHIRPEIFVHLDSFLFIKFDSDFFCAEPF